MKMTVRNGHEVSGRGEFIAPCRLIPEAEDPILSIYIVAAYKSGFPLSQYLRSGRAFQTFCCSVSVELLSCEATEGPCPVFILQNQIAITLPGFEY